MEIPTKNNLYLVWIPRILFAREELDTVPFLIGLNNIFSARQCSTILSPFLVCLFSSEAVIKYTYNYQIRSTRLSDDTATLIRIELLAKLVGTRSRTINQVNSSIELFLAL